jgi:hypothetical protein
MGYAKGEGNVQFFCGNGSRNKEWKEPKKDENYDPGGMPLKRFLRRLRLRGDAALDTKWRQ